MKNTRPSAAAAGRSKERERVLLREIRALKQKLRKAGQDAAAPGQTPMLPSGSIACEYAAGESEERLRMAINAANASIWDWDIARGTVTWNTTYALLFGRSGERDSSPRWWPDRIHPDDRERVLSTMRQAMSTDAETWHEEYRALTRDGTWAHVSDRALIARDRSGKARRIVGAMLDITAPRVAQDALRQSHDELERKVRERTDELTRAYELLRRIFAGIRVHIAYLDRSYNYISVNRAYAEAAGESPEFFAGRNYFDLYPDEENRVIFERVVRTAEPYTVYEKPFVSPDRSDRDVSYWDWSLQPVKDPDGSVSGLLLSSVNVTDRKRAEENNLRLVAAIESAADAVVISDVRGMVLYVNPAFEKITGYGRDEAVGRDQHMLESGRHDEAFFQDLRETIRRDGSWKGRLLNKKKDGTIYNEECTYSAIRNPDGRIINYVSIKRDVTEKLWLESIAHSVETMNNIGYVFAGVRHEIGNPVNAVSMILEVLKSKVGHLDKAAIQGYLDRALGELSRVGYLLRTLKSYNMYEKPHLQQVRMDRFIEQFLSVVREDFKSRGISITGSVESDAEYCSVDPRALQQILLNFLANASDALEGRESRSIAIGVRKQGGVIKIRVEDNGCGMTDEEQKALFKPFYTTKIKGTGLGLVIVKKMLTMMKGTIEISSRKDIGTVVEVSLPDGSRNGASNDHFAKEVSMHEKKD